MIKRGETANVGTRIKYIFIRGTSLIDSSYKKQADIADSFEHFKLWKLSGLVKCDYLSILESQLVTQFDQIVDTIYSRAFNTERIEKKIINSIMINFKKKYEMLDELKKNISPSFYLFL